MPVARNRYARWCCCSPQMNSCLCEQPEVMPETCLAVVNLRWTPESWTNYLYEAQCRACADLTMIGSFVLDRVIPEAAFPYTPQIEIDQQYSLCWYFKDLGASYLPPECPLPAKTWTSLWRPNRAYVKGQIVTSTSEPGAWMCRFDHTSPSSFLGGIDTLTGLPCSSGPTCEWPWTPLAAPFPPGNTPARPAISVNRVAIRAGYTEFSRQFSLLWISDSNSEVYEWTWVATNTTQRDCSGSKVMILVDKPLVYSVPCDFATGSYINSDFETYTTYTASTSVQTTL